MSRISELEFYNDKDVITQIEWLKNNIQADRIDHIQVEQIGDKTSEDYGQTTVKITMENGHEYEGKVTSAILKDVRIQSGEDFNVMVFELANGETISTNIPTGSDSYWALIKGKPQSNTALKAWMDEKAEAVDLTNETRLRVSSDEALGQRITDLDRDVAGEIERLDGELAGKADKSALEEETTKRTEVDTGLLQAITDEETARQSADETLGTAIANKADQSALEEEKTKRTEADTGLLQEIGTLSTAITSKADQSALETEIAARTDYDTGLLQAITAEETARKSADDGIYGRITEINKDLDDETTAREEADALKEDKANRVRAWQATPDDTHYPSEKLTHDAIGTLTSRINESRTSHTTVETGVEQMRVFFDNPDSENVVKGYTLIFLKVDKYFENSTATYFEANIKLSSNRGIEVDAADWGTHFKSYNGVGYVATFSGEGWYLQREDGQPIGTDRLSVTLMIQGKERRL